MREDIQCLRAIAIILVLLYHLYPSVFVNGFLGVDIFFVISGYLMGRTLTHKNLECYQDFIKFYYRRFKRILPLYYLILILALLAVQFCLGDFWWFTNHRYARSALLLSTNQLLISDSADYFNEFQTDISSMNVFIHTWSLGVEMQFYFIVPFIFLMLQFLKSDYQKLMGVLIMTVLGFMGFVMADGKLSFNFMPLRLWQFSAGFLALFWIRIQENNHKNGYKIVQTSEEKIEIEKESDVELETSGKLSRNQQVILVATSFVLLNFLPFNINVLMLRPLVTLATAFLIASDPDDNILLKSKTLSYIGNISYVMYLVHWPVITISNSYFNEYHFCCVAITLFVSIILHECFEKQYLKLDWHFLIPLIIMLIAGNLALQHSVKHDRYWRKSYPDSIQKVITANKAAREYVWQSDPEVEPIKSGALLDRVDKERLRIFGEGRFTGNGSLSVMMLGNSYTMNFEKYLRAHFNHNYSDWRFISLRNNTVIYDNLPLSKLDLQVSKMHVEEYKPDVLIIISRHSEILRDPIVPHDPLLKEINQNLAFYQNFVKKIYILDAHPLYPKNFINKFMHYVEKNRADLESLHLNRKAADEIMKNAAERLRRIECDKCRIFGLSQVFVEGDKYLTFDRNTLLSYVENDNHFTAAGIQLCQPVLERLTREILSTV